MVWGALLGISLQARTAAIAPHDVLRAYGVLAAAGAATAAAVQIGAGLWSDGRRVRGSRRLEFYATGTAVAIASLWWFYAAPTFGLLLGSLVALQAGMNFAIGPYQAAIPDFVDDTKLGAASSWMAAFQSLGNAAGAVLASFVASARAVPAVLSIVLAGTAAATARHVRTLVPIPAAIERFRFNRVFADLFVSRMLVYLGFYTVLGYLYFYAGDRFFTGVMLLTFTIAGAFGAAAAARIADRADRRFVVSAGAAMFVAALIVLAVVHGRVWIVAGGAAAGAAWGVMLTADCALGCAFLPRMSLATSMGVWNLALLAAQVAAPAAATAMLGVLGALHAGGAPRLAFGLAAAWLCAGGAWVWRLPPCLTSCDTPLSGNNG